MSLLESCPPLPQHSFCSDPNVRSLRIREVGQDPTLFLAKKILKKLQIRKYLLHVDAGDTAIALVLS